MNIYNIKKGNIIPIIFNTYGIIYNKRKIVTLIIQDIRRKKWDFDVLDFIVLINLLKGINIKKLKN